MSEDNRRLYFSERAILSPLNVDVDELNDACIDRLSGQSKTFLSADIAINESGYQDHSLPTEFLNIVNLSSMSPHSLTVKVGCPIILLRNLNHALGLCNGTRLIVTAFGERVIEAKILSGIHRGKSVFIPRISISTSTASRLPLLELETSRTFYSSISGRFCYTHIWQVYIKAT